MKQLIVPFVTLVALIAFFVIIDRKEFHLLDNVQTVQSESPTTNRELSATGHQTKTAINANSAVETKPVETKSVYDAKPVTEVKPKPDTKPAEMETVVETETAEVKPVAVTKPVESKPMTDSKSVVKAEPEEKVKPAAVPVVTPEEAERRNDFAIFLSTVKLKTTVVEGEITERSELPDPQKSDYPNCRFTAHFTGNSIKSGEPCPKELSLIVEGFEDYKYLDSSKIDPGDKIECCIIPFDSLSEEYKSTQQADDLNLFLLENYYVIEIKKINTFSDSAIMPQSGIFFSDGAKEYISLFERHLNNPLSEEVKKAQNESTQNDLRKMDLILKGYDDEKIKDINARFNEVWNAEKKKDPPGYNRVEKYVWRNIDNSFWCLPVDYTFLSKPALLTQKTLDAFAALKEACEANGVQLIVSLIPYYTDISSRVINKDFQNVPDLQTAIYVKQLSEIGVETIYSAETLIHNYNRYPFAYFYPADNHPSDTAQDINTDILAERLKRYNIEPELNPALFSVRQRPHLYGDKEAYLFPKDCDIADNEVGTSYTCREVLYDGKPIQRTSDAPIITLGNSYLQTPMASPASFPTLLSMKLLTHVDFFQVFAFGPFTTIISQLFANPERYLAHKKVFIMHVGTQHLTEVNAKSIMINVREEDENRLLFNKKTMVLTYDDLNNVEVDDSIDNSLWENLPKKHIYRIDEEEVIDIARFSIESDINSSADIVCMIPTICFRGKAASLVVNGISKGIPTFWNNPTYAFISFLLPSGTKTIEIRAVGNDGAVFAIKDIEIWQ